MSPQNTDLTSEEHFADIVRAFSSYPGVSTPSMTTPSGKFGSSGLRVHEKIFAMISSKGQFVVKLPRQRVDELVAAGIGERFDTGHGRFMKEWLAVESGLEDRWQALAKEALDFVASLE